MKKIATILAVLISTVSAAQDIQIERIDSIVTSKIGEKDPSLIVGVVKDGEIVYEKYCGLANLQHQVKATPETRSNIASTAKQFTALMVLQLSLENKLSLEDDIRKYVPNLYPNVKEEIKIRHLINHTSGIRDAYDLMSIQRKPWWRQEGLDNDDILELLAKQKDLAFTPGSRYMYSNSGYIILTKIISEVTEMPFHEYSGTFFRELGMENTTFVKNYMHVIPNKAYPYSDWGDGVWQEYPMMTNLYGDGFLFTTLRDQLKFEQAIQNAKDNYNVLLIESQKAIPNSEITTYGFGLELEDRLNYSAVHHSGGTGSYHSQVVRFPSEKLSVFVMSANSRIWSGSIADEVASVLLPEKEVPVSYDNRITMTSKMVSKDQFVGQYLSPSDYLIRIEEKDNEIFWRNGNNNPIALEKEKDNVYTFVRNPKLKIGFFSDEFVLFYPSGKVKVYSKMAAEPPTLADLESYTGDYYSGELDVEFAIRLTDDNKLKISRTDWKQEPEVEALNRNELLVWDYILKIERDRFDRVTGILLTTNRVLNNRFQKKSNLQYQPKVAADYGSIQVTTIGSKKGGSQILLTRNEPNGNEIWATQFGGRGYDKAGSILATEDGYLIIGSTSSYGKGNYDMLLIKTDKEGKKLWQKTYGTFYNDYGYAIERIEGGYLLKGTQQNCTSNTDVFNRECTTNVWFVTVDANGNEVSNDLLEEITEAP